MFRALFQFAVINRSSRLSTLCSRFLLGTLAMALAISLSACNGGDSSAPPVQIIPDNQTDPVAASPGIDTIKPTASITAPDTDAVITGVTSLYAYAADNIGVVGVQFRVNGANAGSEDTSRPYSISYDTTSVVNGSYAITAVARDAAGNVTTSSAVNVTVSNPTAPPTAPPPTPTPDTISKPAGIFSSAAAGSMKIYQNPNLHGALIRAGWDEIEPSPGVFDFSSIASEISTVKANGSSWSLAVIGGGTGSPSWLIDQLDAPYISYEFRGEAGFRLPLYWDGIVQDRIKQLAQRLAQEYNADASLKLVYVTQMSANGIEGHLQGVDMTTFKNAGYTDDRWVEAGKQAARSYAEAFTNKAIAFEVHEVNKSATVPSRIINDLWNDSTLGQRVGAGMWWISGKTDYQSALIDVLKSYPGDLYGQVIARSNDTESFEKNDYTTVFSQAMEIGLRYIEVWEYEVMYGTGTANGAWDATFAEFNTYADALDGTASLP